MKPLTTSVYTFSDLIAGGYLYVDKTQYIYELVREFKGQYFLARPRRFGKSLLISTLKAIFLGQRELFDGLYITNTDYDWQTYPVIHLDLGTAAAQTAEGLEEALCYAIDSNAQTLNISLMRKRAAGRFQELVDNLARRDGKVVILVDEYDKPLLGHLEKPTAPEIQRILKEFYSVIKTTESQQRFALLTGVSKFSKVSIFSDLNNLTDLTMRKSTATLLGYTQSELETNFSEYIAALSNELGKNRKDVLTDLRDWYNGYRFHAAAETVYNPVSLMKCFDELELKNYWFETGTPTFLVELLKRHPLNLDDLTVTETAFAAYEPEYLEPLPLLVQTGYLTIKDVKITGRSRQYRLGFPNYEIKESFSMWLAKSFCARPQTELNSALNRMLQALEANDVDLMLEALKTFFDKVPNNITLKHEKYYQTIFFTAFTLIGAMTEAEVNTSIGRIDAVVKTRTDIFLFEFKLHGTAAEALTQIHDRRYADAYLDDGRRITLIGAAFDVKERNLAHWLIEKMDETQSHNPSCVREAGATYDVDDMHPQDLNASLPGLACAVQRHLDAAHEIEKMEKNRQHAEKDLIAAWAPFVRNIWQSWHPVPGEVIAMLYLYETPPNALRHIVKECNERCLCTKDWEKSDTTYRTELDADPADNEQACFPVPLHTYKQLATTIEMHWIDRNPYKKTLL